MNIGITGPGRALDAPGTRVFVIWKILEATCKILSLNVAGLNQLRFTIKKFQKHPSPKYY